MISKADILQMIAEARLAWYERIKHWEMRPEQFGTWVTLKELEDKIKAWNN